MAIPKYIEIDKDDLSTTPISSGNIIYCKDTKMTFFDTSANVRIQINNINIIPSEEIRTSMLAPVANRLYVVRETKELWRYSGVWIHIKNEWQIMDLVGDVELLTPVSLQVSENEVTPTTLTSCVFNNEGISLDEIIANAVSTSRTIISFGYEVSIQAYQKVFNIPFPFSTYLEEGNGFFCFIGMTFVDPTRYTVAGGRLVFNDEDDGVALGRKITFVFVYNIFKPDTEEIEELDGSCIIDESIPLSKIEGSSELMTYSKIAKGSVELDESVVSINDEYDEPNVYYIGKNIGSIILHLNVEDGEKIYTDPIGRLPFDARPSIPVYNVIISTDKGPMDISIAKNGYITAGCTLKPSSPTIINGSIQLLI